MNFKCMTGDDDKEIEESAASVTSSKFTDCPTASSFKTQGLLSQFVVSSSGGCHDLTEDLGVEQVLPPLSVAVDASPNFKKNDSECGSPNNKTPSKLLKAVKIEKP